MSVEFIQIGEVFVDSGQIMVGDPSYLDEFAPGEPTAVQPDANGDFPYSYSGAYSATASDSGAGQLAARPDIGSAVVTRTASGDGIYPVFQVFEDGRLVGLHIDLTV